MRDQGRQRPVQAKVRGRRQALRDGDESPVTEEAALVSWRIFGRLPEAGHANDTPPVILEIRVKPRARSSELVQAADGSWVAKLKSPPVDGKANEELIALVAERFGCRKSAVTIKAGATGRTKLVRVEA